MKTHSKKLIVLLTFLGVFCCKESSKNITEMTSSDIEKLDKLLNFEKFRPTKVKFKYVFIDNSGQNERLSVPGPSDYYLEALLEFDSITFTKMKAIEKDMEWIEQNHQKEAFNFEWLPQHIQQELDTSNPNYKGHPDLFFNTGSNGKIWYLNNKILIKKYSN
ncbi:hypothetical protein [Winogradskyella psychrotolerans]|uniref:hypothetical protein n=1 Tax=Winogradskyella psychrotolerans TaxID=1344585 RepID=UPI001C077FB1|nr:hypothetical protein [Winogradskyella psychrotolerans]MBU2929955.1 hypothetical protein [Winogradskyella psychrotolerans]